MSHAHFRSFGAAKDEVFSCVVSIQPEECGLTRAEFRFGKIECRERHQRGRGRESGLLTVLQSHIFRADVDRARVAKHPKLGHVVLHSGPSLCVRRQRQGRDEAACDESGSSRCIR